MATVRAAICMGILGETPAPACPGGWERAHRLGDAGGGRNKRLCFHWWGWRRRHRESEGRFLLREAFMSEEATLAFPAPPVRFGLGVQRKAQGRPLRCLRVPIRTKAGHLSC